MKKLLLLALFAFVGFTMGQAQHVNYSFTNNTGSKWLITVDGTYTVGVNANSTVTGTYPDAVEVPFDFDAASAATGCSTTPSPITLSMNTGGWVSASVTGCTGTAPSFQYALAQATVTPFDWTFLILIQ
ncbi:MAG: hypothetical protein GC192_05825 [Bacteroidetes bacterium]|nr:hypothetical protein [Bacteroidota bacterium]